MKHTKGMKHLSLIVSMMLMFTMVFGSFASQAASTKSMYVIYKVKSTTNYEGETFSETVKYSYQKGLIKKVTNDGNYASSFRYYRNSKGKITKYKDLLNGQTYKVKKDSKGRIIEAQCSDPYTGKKMWGLEYAYNKKNRCTKSVVYVDAVSIWKYSYDSKGKLTKAKMSTLVDPSDYIYLFKYTYDIKGNVKECIQKPFVTNYTNTYSNGRLKTVAKDDGTTWTFYYKKVDVPKKYVKRVKAEQKWIKNTTLEIIYYDLLAVN